MGTWCWLILCGNRWLPKSVRRSLGGQNPVSVVSFYHGLAPGRTTKWLQMFLSQLNNGAWGFGFKHLKGLQGVCRGSATSMHGMFPRPDSSHVPTVLLLSLLLCWWRFLSTCGLMFVFLESVLTLDRAVKIAQPIYDGMTHPPSNIRMSSCGICGDSRVSWMVFPWKGVVALTGCLNELKMC